LSDPDKRAKYDRGEIDAAGAPKPDYQFYRAHAGGPGGEKYASSAGFGDFADMGDVFADLFGRGRGGSGTSAGLRMAGQDVSYTLAVSFLEAANGTKKRVTMPDGKELQVSVPEGVKDRQTLRLKGQGGPGLGGGPTGDAYIELHIQPHAFFERKDSDVHMELPVALGEAVLGAKVEVPTVAGPVSLTVPKGSNSGTVLRLKGRGIKEQGSPVRGDQYVRLKVVLPQGADPELERFVADWAAKHPYDPRSGMKG
jgi:DnaJ-class molecular chaperone